MAGNSDSSNGTVAVTTGTPPIEVVPGVNTRRRWWLIGVVLAGLVIGVGGWWFRAARIARLSSECIALASREDWPRLEIAARQWTRWQSAPVAWYWLGMSLKSQRQFPEAKQAFLKVPLAGPRGVDAAIERLEITYHVEHRPLEAIELAKALLDRDPKLASPRRHLILFCAMTFQRVELIRQVRLAIDQHVDLPEHYIYLFLLEDLSFRDGQEVTARWAEANPDSLFLRRVQALHRVRAARDEARLSPTPELTAVFLRVRQEFADAIDLTRPDPLELDLLLLLAMGDNDQAAAGKLLALVPESAVDDPVFWRYRGWYSTQAGDFAGAIQSYREALRIHPLAWQSRSEMSTALRLAGDVQEAGKEQTIAGLGSDLHVDLRRLSHAKSASAQLLARLAKFAKEAGDFKIANGILRRRQIAESSSTTPQ
ncbi:MAG: hypothetical protein JSS02_14865 [Planctomycetes bacterium]|nr:hypothetical protein [Planctomycetota bacterium]